MVVRCNSSRPGRRTSRSAFKGEVPGGDDPLLGFAPYLHKAARRNSITPDKQRAFIAALAASGIVTQAARVIGVSLEALYKLRHLPGAEGFAAAWEEAVDRGMERLEDCALERAIAGEERVVVRNGEVVATWRRYDTGLMMFLLRSRRRGRYEAYVPVRAEERVSEAEMRRRAQEEQREADDVLRGLNAKLERMREREMARRAEEEEVLAGEEEALEEEAPAPPEDVSEAAEEAVPGVRILDRLLQEGDAALGLPRLTPHKRMVGMIGRAYLRSPYFSPQTDDEMVQAQWLADLEAGRIGPGARLPGEEDGARLEGKPVKDG